MARNIFITFAAILLFLLLLLSAASFLLSTQTGSQWIISQAMQRASSSGIPLTIDGVEGTIFRGLSFQRISLADEAGNYVIEGLRTSWNPYSLLTGQLLLSDLWISSLRVELLSSSEEAGSKLDIGVVSNPLPIGVTISRLRIERLEVMQQGQEFTLRSIALGAALAGDDLEVSALQLEAEGFAVEAGAFSLRFTGNRPINARFDWHYDTVINDRPQELAGHLEISGDLSGVEIVHQLNLPQRIDTSGSVETGFIAGEFEFALNHSAPTLVLPFDIPADYEISNVSLGTTGNLEEISLSIESDVVYEQYPDIRVAAAAAYANSVLSLSSYNLAAAGNSISGAVIIDWSDVLSLQGGYALQLPAIDAFIDLPQSIVLADLAAEGDFDIALPDEGVEGRLSIAALSGQLSEFPLQGRGAILFRPGSIEVNDLQLQTQSNQISLDGSYSDTLDLNWSVSVASLQEFLAGSEGELEGNGRLEGDPAAPNIVGTLVGRDIAYQQIDADEFSFDFSRIDGQVQSELSIDRITYTDGAFVETVAPVVLKVSGSETNHRIDVNAVTRFGDFIASLSGGVDDLQNISWEGSLESASVDTPVGSWATRFASELTIASAGVDVTETCWVQQGATICYEFEQSIDSGVAATGSLQNYPLNIFNSGQILNAGASVNLVQDQLLLFPQLPQGAAISGRVDGRFSLALPVNDDLLLNFDLAATETILSVTPELLSTEADIDEEQLIQEYNLEVLELSGNSEAGGWRLQAGAEILRENLDDSEIDVRGVINANVGIAANYDLSGTIDAGLEDLRWLQALVPELSNIEGSLVGQANLEGNLSAPQATGSIDLQNASVAIDSLGITIANITANVSSDGPESVQLIGRAQSDSGMLDFNGEIIDPFAEATTFSAELRGDNFQLANIPNLELTVSPNVILSVDGTSIEVIGSINVPILKLTLEELPETAVDVSRDVVIVNYPSDRPDLARSIAATESTVFDRPLTGAIDISLGDDVSFTGFGMSTKLAGNLNIQQTVGGSNRTYGELTIVDGTYEMYRQSLNISQGKFLFFGAYDNPGIDLRATREVDNYTVGVLMNGTLKNINSQLFSTPALPDNDIIAVLVTGRPFSEAGEQDGNAMLSAIARLGVDRSEGLTNQVRSSLGLDVLAIDASDDINNSVLTIGKYLTPDIFVRYGIGLFDSQSKVAVDYTLSERVKLQAESGEYQSVDIIYSVER